MVTYTPQFSTWNSLSLTFLQGNSWISAAVDNQNVNFTHVSVAFTNLHNDSPYTCYAYMIEDVDNVPDFQQTPAVLPATFQMVMPTAAPLGTTHLLFTVDSVRVRRFKLILSPVSYLNVPVAEFLQVNYRTAVMTESPG